jgi:hypothetical protein
VVTVSSTNHRQGRIHFDDLTGERKYSAMAFYNQSKFANAVFGRELHRRLYASTDPSVEGGQFIGPDGLAELRGRPTRVQLSPAADDAETGSRLWELSEHLTDVRFAFPTPV